MFTYDKGYPMNKKSLFLFFILVTGIISSSCKAYTANSEEFLVKQLEIYLHLFIVVTASYYTHKYGNAYFERQKEYALAARNNAQIIAEATTFYKNAFGRYKTVIGYLGEGETLESSIINHVIVSSSDYTYPFLVTHNHIQKTVLPGIVQHKKWIQDKIDKGEVADNLLEEAELLLQNFDKLRIDLQKIDQIIVLSNQFNEDKKHKALLDVTEANKPFFSRA